MNSKRISIFLGHFGSGKSEVAVNYAISLAKSGKLTAIADMDIVNPFFRTADVIEELHKSEVRTVVPTFVGTNSEISTITSEVNTLFENKSYDVVFDIGGDDLGAKILSRYKEELTQEECEVFMVINTKRSNTSTPEKIVKMINEIEISGSIKITKLINNSNILEDTTIDTIIDGFGTINEASKLSNIPVAFTSFMKKFESDFKYKTVAEYMTLDKYIKLPFYT